MKKRTLNELRQVKTYGYRPPLPSKEKDSKNENKIDMKSEELRNKFAKAIKALDEAKTNGNGTIRKPKSY